MSAALRRISGGTGARLRQAYGAAGPRPTINAFPPDQGASLAAGDVTKNVTHILLIFDPGFVGLLYFINQNTQFGLDFYKKC
jgi:hypothetical protein